MIQALAWICVELARMEIGRVVEMWLKKQLHFKDCIFSTYKARGSIRMNISLSENSQRTNGMGLKNHGPM